MKHHIMLAFSLIAFWLANSGHYTGLILSLGLISIALSVYLAHRMDVIDHESQPMHLTFKIPGYFAWLTKEIILSNIQVVKHIWLGNHTISPVFSTISVSQQTEMGRVIYANSITLTPGTVTVNLEGDKFLVHALVEDSIKDLESGEMDRRVTLLEK